MAAENRRQGATWLDSAGIVMSCNELAAKRDAGSVTPKPLARCPFCLSCVPALSFTFLHESDAGPSL